MAIAPRLDSESFSVLSQGNATQQGAIDGHPPRTHSTLTVPRSRVQHVVGEWEHCQRRTTVERAVEHCQQCDEGEWQPVCGYIVSRLTAGRKREECVVLSSYVSHVGRAENNDGDRFVHARKGDKRSWWERQNVEMIKMPVGNSVTFGHWSQFRRPFLTKN